MKGFIRTRHKKDGKPRYQVIVKIDGRKRSLGTFRLKKDAVARLKRAEAEYAAGNFGRESLTLTDWYNRWLPSKHNIKESTRVSYEHTFRLHILPTLGAMRLEDITRLNVQAWIDGLKRSDMSPATVGRCFRYFKACMKEAEASDLIVKAPTAKINLPRCDHPEISFLGPVELALLLDETKEPERTLYAVLAMSGLRLGEALALRWQDINFEMRAFGIQRAWSYWGGFQDPKTPKSRRAVPLIDWLSDTLRDYYHSKGHPDLDELLFTHDDKKPLDQSNTLKALKKRLKEAGLKEVDLKSFRHSYATIAISSGASIKALQNALGHSSATTTLNTYSHLLKEDMGDSLAKMNQLITGADGKLIRFPRKYAEREE